MSSIEAQLKSANRTNLFGFLEKNHSDKISQEDTMLHLLENPNICVRKNQSVYTDTATGKTGDAVSLLVEFLGYSEDEAIAVLDKAPKVLRRLIRHPATVRELVLPDATKEKCSQLYAYLCHHGIPKEVLIKLLREGLMYQADSPYHEIVFVNKERDFAEIRQSGRIPYFKLLRKSLDRYWAFYHGEHIKTAYICESAIDAISLFILTGWPGCYISIAYDKNQDAIDSIKHGDKFDRIFLAMNNDGDGILRRKENPDLWQLIPVKEDWNEDLMERIFK